MALAQDLRPSAKTEGLGGLNGAHADSATHRPNAWMNAGPAAYDFRSDIVTTPTASMLASIQNTTLLDDVFREDPTTTALEEYVAHLAGHEAGLFVTSGTMGNQLSIRSHLAQPPHSIVADRSSHILEWEAGGVALLSGALAIPIDPANRHHLTLTDIKKYAVTSKDVHACPTRLICLENTLAGTVLPLDECQAISQWAREQQPPIAMHLDGARLWEAVASGAGSLRDYCACFDSISLCFSKGLGAPIGSMIVGSTSLIERARHLRKAIGGGMRQAGVVTAAARVGVDETFLGGKLAATHERAKEVARLWEEKGGCIERSCETNMVWLDLEKARVAPEAFVEAGVKEGVKVRGGRLVVHYQISNEAVRRLSKVMDAVLPTQPTPKIGLKIVNGTKRKAQTIMEPEME